MSSETGKQILTGLAETRRLFGQLSTLIQTADRMLEEEGWGCISGNSCTQVTSHLKRPSQWMPRTIYSFYRLGEGVNGGAETDMILVLGVLLDRDGDGAWGGFQEPWVTFGMYEFQPGRTPAKFRYEEWVEEPLVQELDPDGSFHPYKYLDDEIEENEGLVYQEVAAVPLISIQGVEDLKRQVMDPLLERTRARLE